MWYRFVCRPRIHSQISLDIVIDPPYNIMDGVTQMTDGVTPEGLSRCCEAANEPKRTETDRH